MRISPHLEHQEHISWLPGCLTSLSAEESEIREVFHDEWLSLVEAVKAKDECFNEEDFK